MPLRSLFLLVATIWAFALGTQPLPGAVIELGTTAINGIMESYPSNNLGALEWFPCGATQNLNCGTPPAPLPCDNRGLIRFDPAQAIPHGSFIKEVTFLVAVVVQPPAVMGEPNQYFDIHRLLVPWGEGEGQNQPGKFPGEVGRPAIAGESSWFMRQAPSNAWAIPGGAAGVDYVAQASGESFISDDKTAGPFPFASISNRMAADLQLWLDHPEQNHGWLMKVRNLNTNDFWSAKRFENPESGIAGFPVMGVTYLPPILLTNFRTNGNGTSFQFKTDVGQPYVVQYRDSLSEVAWQKLGDVPAMPESVTVFMIDSMGGTNAPERYYRVIAPQ